jgi:hypothetical protein
LPFVVLVPPPDCNHWKLWENRVMENRKKGMGSR